MLLLQFRKISYSLCLLVLFVFSSTLVRAEEAKVSNCMKQTRTEMEKVFCQIKDAGEGNSLPSLLDFRKNSHQVQALLLTRPAKKLGLKLPKEKVKTKKAVAASNSPKTTTTDKASSSHKAPSLKQEEMQPKADPRLANCLIKREKIECHQQQYKLINNRPNNELSAEAFMENNRLILPKWDKSNGQSEKEYLLEAYQIYIDKMLQIGLGAATMSFTRFFQNYEELNSQKVDFSNRFATMYEYLKADKQKIYAPKQLVKERPSNISNCDIIRQGLIACDNGFNNWLYQVI